MKEFTEDLRYEYDLNEDSWVIDIGAFMGDFSRKIGARYHCNIIAFEPIRSFWHSAVSQQHPKTTVINAGIGKDIKNENFGISADSTGAWCESKSVEVVSILPVSLPWPCAEVDLIKINAEGSEYDILEDIITWCGAEHFLSIQVQWHPVVPDHVARRAWICSQLSKTHHQEWLPNDVNWENWTTYDD